jgi:transcriptional regulator with XRE-family HTH domain
VIKTAMDGLRLYEIGEKLRGLRLRKSMGLVQLGKHTGLSAAMLSKLERGKLFPTLPTLLRIATVFNVGLEYFFTDDRRRHILAVIRRKDRIRFPERVGGGAISYFFESLDFPVTERKLSAFLVEFQPVELQKARDHHHTGAEFIYVMTGRLSIRVGSDEQMLEAGDSIYFDPSLKHRYSSVGKRPCTAIVVAVP